MSNSAPESARSLAATSGNGRSIRPQNGFTAMKRSSGQDGAMRPHARLTVCFNAAVGSAGATAAGAGERGALPCVWVMSGLQPGRARQSHAP